MAHTSELPFLADSPRAVTAPRASHPSQENLATVKDARPVRASMHDRSGPSPASATALPTTVSAMNLVEAKRTYSYVRHTVLQMVMGGLLMPFFGGDPTLRAWVVAGMVWTAVSVIGVTAFYRKAATVPKRLYLLATIPYLTTSVVVTYWVGFCSPVWGLMSTGIFVTGMNGSRAAGLLAWGSAALTVGVGTVLVLFGIIPDISIFRLAALSPLQILAFTLMAQFGFGMIYLLARRNHRTTVRTVSRLEEALRQIGQRDALLVEVKNDLERVLGAGDGRWTGHRAGPWRLGKIVGRGGFGEVYEGSDTSGALAAVKVLNLELGGSEDEQRRRFRREAEAALHLDHPNVVKVFAIGDDGEGPPYIAMELLRGQDLATLLRQRRRLSLGEVERLVSQVGSALEAARRANIVHRDLKPQNVFALTPEGRAPDYDPDRWKVLDFGVAKCGASSGTLTRGQAIGTPGYMSPEQALGKECDHRSDVFSLAVIAYRALTGRPAFSGDGAPMILFDAVYRQPERPGTFGPLPEDVDLVLALGMAKNADDRFATAAEFALAFEQALARSLPPAQRDRARALLSQQPWGQLTTPSAR
jgi:serine/threonine-protein kinase